MEALSQKFLASTEGARLMVQIAKRAAYDSGMAPEEVPGHPAVVTMLTAGDRQGIAAIRTSRNRHFGFVPLSSGSEWKTLDEVSEVLVTTVDKLEDPQALEVYLFPAKEVRKALDASYAARKAAGQKTSDGYGMWIGIDTDDSDKPYGGGSGLGDRFPPIAKFSYADISGESAVSLDPVKPSSRPTTIAEVLSWARGWISEISGVGADSVKLELKIEA